MKRSRSGVVLGIVFVTAVLLLAGAAALAFHYVPFDLPSFAAWAGIALAALSFLSVLKPPAFLGIRSRLRSALVLLLAVALAVTAVVWPSTIARAAGPHQRLDDFLAEYQAREYHETLVEAPIDRVVAAARQVSFAEMPVAVGLMRIRALAAFHLTRGPVDPRPILDIMSQPGTGFLPLDTSNPQELVFGMVGAPWKSTRPPRVRNAQDFLALTSPGYIRVAFNIRIDDAGAGKVRLSTETRCLANDPDSRRIFARYWRLIYPGSAIIRRVWMDAIATRAVS
jgi:hypothetical protein